MPDRATPLARWRWLGKLLPRETRERLYEPALTDLWLRWRNRPAAHEAVPFPLQAFGTLLGCVPNAVVGLVMRRRRLTRFGQAIITLLAIVSMFRLIASQLGLYH